MDVCPKQKALVLERERVQTHFWKFAQTGPARLSAIFQHVNVCRYQHAEFGMLCRCASSLWISAFFSLLFVWMSVCWWGVGVCLFLLAEHTCLKGFSPLLNSSTIPPSLVSREAEMWGSCRRSCSDPACLLATGLFGPGPGSGSKRRNRVPERRECWGRD